MQLVAHAEVTDRNIIVRPMWYGSSLRNIARKAFLQVSRNGIKTSATETWERPTPRLRQHHNLLTTDPTLAES